MLDVPCSERVWFFKSLRGEKSLIGLISGTSGVSHIKGGIGKQFYKSGILQLHLERVPPGNEICCESPECVRMSLSQAWRSQDSRRKWLIPQEQQSQGCQSNVSSSHEEEGRGRRTLWVIGRRKLRKTKKKKQNVCQGHSQLDQSCFPAHRQVWGSGRLWGLCSKAKRRGNVTIPALYKRSLWKEKWENYPSCSTQHPAHGLLAWGLHSGYGRRQTEDKDNKSNRYHLLNTYSGDRSSAEHFYTYYIYSSSFIK